MPLGTWQRSQSIYIGSGVPRQARHVDRRSLNQSRCPSSLPTSLFLSCADRLQLRSVGRILVVECLSP